MTNRTFARRFGQAAMVLLGLLLGIGMAQAAETVTYYHTDALGTPVMESNAAGTVIYAREHKPYGEQALGAAKDGPGFTGHVGDADTGLTYMQARYYDPVTARFLSNDPVAHDLAAGSNYNHFWYANNNPYTFIDPDGRRPRSGGTLCSETSQCETGSFSDGGGGGGGQSSEPATSTSNNGSTIPTAPTPGQWSTQQNQQSDGPDLFSNGNIFDMESLAHDLYPLLYMTPEGAGAAATAKGTLSVSMKLAAFEGKLGPAGHIFGRQAMGGRSVLGINNNAFLRVGWGWKGSRTTGQHVFRISSDWLKKVGVKDGHLDLFSLPPP